MPVRLRVHWLWTGTDVGARLARLVLTPLEVLFRVGVWVRSLYYDRRGSVPAPCPAVSVGNLTVGGTGKTPVAAWCLQQLHALGATPALVMRGVGDDETFVHARINPGTPVYASIDRVAGMRTAVARGADCVVLDDAFQHRRAGRTVDLVLVSADAWSRRQRLLPCGPFRESLAALRRADVVGITVKAATADRVAAMRHAIRAVAPHVPVATLRLAPEGLRRGDGPVGVEALDWLHGRTMVLTSGIGDPVAFERQVRGFRVALSATYHFPDHHQFSDMDVAELVEAARGTDGVLCTLKDAVKLGPRWPAVGPPLWYLSQTVMVEQGADALQAAFRHVLMSRQRPSSASHDPSTFDDNGPGTVATPDGQHRSS